MAIQAVYTVINGQQYALTLNSGTGKYEATITAPSTSSYNNNDGHYYPVAITATDDAGNITTVDDTHASMGMALRLKVKEKIAPTVTITGPTAGATIINNKPAITAQLRDNDSGVAVDTIILKVDNVAAPVSSITKTPVDDGYNISYTPSSALTDGNHSISLQVSDNDGNQCSAKTSTFKVDTVPPTLSITSPADGLATNTAALTVTGTTNDATSSPVTVAIKLNGNDQGSVTVNAQSGAFSKALILTEGSNTIEIKATDAAGKTTTITRTVILDTTAPIISDITIVPNPVDCGTTYVISATVVD